MLAKDEAMGRDPSLPKALHKVFRLSINAVKSSINVSPKITDSDAFCLPNETIPLSDTIFTFFVCDCIPKSSIEVNTIDFLEENNIIVTERLPLKVGQTPENSRYLNTKAQRSGHIIE